MSKATTPQPMGCSDGINLSGAPLKKVQVYVNSMACIQALSVRLLSDVVSFIRE